MNIQKMHLTIPGLKAKNFNQVFDSLKSAKDFQGVVKRERARSNRTNQKFVVIAFKVDTSEENAEEAAEFLEYVQARIRLTDEIGWFDESRIGVLLANTSIAGAQKLLDDMASHFNDVMRIPQFSIYPYPRTDLSIVAM